MAPAADIDPGAIRHCVLQDGDVSVTILNLGCITQDWVVPSKDGPVSVVLGYRDPADYVHNPAYLGAIVGRVANRIRDAQFAIDKDIFPLNANQGPHLLHGGPGGLSNRLWQQTPDGDRALRLRLVSHHGDQGFPGKAIFTVTISLDGKTLTYDMHAEVDRPTPINLAQHNYYNLMGQGDVRDHSLSLAARTFTPLDTNSIPQGDILPVHHSRYDFTQKRSFAQADPKAVGYDINYGLDHSGPVAEVVAPNGMRLTLATDQPGLQLYCAQHLPALHTSLPRQSHGPYGGFCLEAQGFPNAVNIPVFPSIMATPDAPYHQTTTVTITDR